MDVPEVRTERLLMRGWRPEDREPFAALNADPVVMEHLPRLLTQVESDAFVDRIEQCWAERGWGLWAIEVPEGDDRAPFIGYVGLWPADPVEPGAVEVGWRIAKERWGRGFAPEAAREAMAAWFDDLGGSELLSFTVPQNHRSRRVMEKIGLRRDPSDDFDHPGVDRELRCDLVRHVLYRLTAAEWAARKPSGYRR